MSSAARYLIFHGAIVLMVGLLCGIPYGKAINRKRPEPMVHSWRIAHQALPIGAILMIAVAAVLSSFAVTALIKWVIAVALIVSSYGFCFSLPLAAVVGHRGLSARGPAAAKWVYLGNIVGAMFSLVAAFALLYAA